MFYSRNILKTYLVCNKKVPTFAPALRERRCSLVLDMLKNKIKNFSKKFGSLKISITFAAAFRGK
jgi:hypothetical protein